MEITYKKLDTQASNFDQMFSLYSSEFYSILEKSYLNYYGQDYHNDRIKNGNSILYLAFLNENLIGVSYVKRNNRRGGTAVYPEKYRKLGIAKRLVKLSLIDFPKQYTILSTNFPHSIKMLSLMRSVDFHMACTELEVKNIVSDEYTLLSNFRYSNGYFVFDRLSEKRSLQREFLTLLHTY